MWFKKKRKEYKQYKLDFISDINQGVLYFITVFSGNKALKLMVDSGCASNLIGNKALKGCSYYNTGMSENTIGVSGEMPTRIIYLEFSLDKLNKSNPEYPYSMEFSVALKKDAPLFNNDDIDGLLGSRFLQYCEVDFRNGYLRVFNDRKSGLVNKEFEKSITGLL